MSSQVFAVLHVFDVVLLIEEDELPARRVLCHYTGDSSAGEVTHVLQQGCTSLLDGLSGFEHVLCSNGNELEAITLVLNL